MYPQVDILTFVEQSHYNSHLHHFLNQILVDVISLEELHDKSPLPLP